jgi:hypothetical protein
MDYVLPNKEWQPPYLQALSQQVALPAGAKRSLYVALKHCKQHDASKHG